MRPLPHVITCLSGICSSRVGVRHNRGQMNATTISCPRQVSTIHGLYVSHGAERVLVLRMQKGFQKRGPIRCKTVTQDEMRFLNPWVYSEKNCRTYFDFKLLYVQLEPRRTNVRLRRNLDVHRVDRPSFVSRKLQ